MLSWINSLEFAICGSFSKISDIGSKDIVYECMNIFNVQLPTTECAFNRRSVNVSFCKIFCLQLMSYVYA